MARPSTAGIVEQRDGSRVVAATVRPDGTVRPQRRVRPGFVPAEDVPAYRPPHLRGSTGRDRTAGSGAASAGLASGSIGAKSRTGPSVSHSADDAFMADTTTTGITGSAVTPNGTLFGRVQYSSQGRQAVAVDPVDELVRAIPGLAISSSSDANANAGSKSSSNGTRRRAKSGHARPQTDDASGSRAQRGTTAAVTGVNECGDTSRRRVPSQIGALSSTNAGNGKAQRDPSQQENQKKAQLPSPPIPAHKIRNLQKRLKQIEALEDKLQKQLGGDMTRLEKEQVEKLRAKDDVLAQIAAFKKQAEADTNF